MTSKANSKREQSVPVVARVRESYSVIRPISQITLRLKQNQARDRFAETVDSILRWINKRAGRRLPEDAWQRKSFELSDIGSQRTAAVAMSTPRYWAARLDDADKNVPLRTWVTEIGVGVDENGDVLFGARLICTTRGDDEPFERSIPGFCKEIIGMGSAELDGVSLTGMPKFLSSVDDVRLLVELLENVNRTADVIVFALPEGSLNPIEASASVSSVHQRTLGLAHVFVISGPASFELTDRVGRELSVFKQGVRIYRPQFRAWIDQPSNHPLFFHQRIATWEEEGALAFERWIVGQTLARSVHTPSREQRLPAFNTVRQLATQFERNRLKEAGASDSELATLYEQDNEQLRKELKEQKEQYDGLLVAADAERESAIQAADAAKSQALERLHRIRLLESRLAKSSVHEKVEIPSSLDNFEAWCKENLVGAVELVNRAFQGVRKSDFHDPAFIYQALVFMRDYYVPMRIEGTTERRQAYEAELAALQLEESATGEGVNYAADLYSVQYAGARRQLDRHLKGSNSRDRRFGFRVYFFWDDEGQVAVVGWLPSHLDNRGS